MISVDSYKHLVIIEHDTFYSIKFIDNNDGEKIIKFDKKENEINKMIDLLGLYLKLYKVNGFDRMALVYDVKNNENLLPEVMLSNGLRKIHFKTKIEFFSFFSKMVLDNYVRNKESLIKNINIFEVKVDASSNASKFICVDNTLNLTLEADSHMNICVYERQFVAELLEYRCFSKKINVELVQEKNEDKEYYMAICGEFKMIFPKEYTYSTLIRIINEHNGKIDKIRKRR